MWSIDPWKWKQLSRCGIPHPWIKYRLHTDEHKRWVLTTNRLRDFLSLVPNQLVESNSALLWRSQELWKWKSLIMITSSFYYWCFWAANINISVWFGKLFKTRPVRGLAWPPVSPCFSEDRSAFWQKSTAAAPEICPDLLTFILGLMNRRWIKQQFEIKIKKTSPKHSDDDLYKSGRGVVGQRNDLILLFVLLLVLPSPGFLRCPCC